MDWDRDEIDPAAEMVRVLRLKLAFKESREQLNQALRGCETTSSTALSVLETTQPPLMMLEQLAERLEQRQQELAAARRQLDEAFALLLDHTPADEEHVPVQEGMLQAYRVANASLDRSEWAMAQMQRRVERRLNSERARD